jgi:hypothetical protein
MTEVEKSLKALYLELPLVIASYHEVIVTGALSEKDAEIKRLREAMGKVIDLLENCSVGGVGEAGMSMAEMETEWEKGNTACDSAEYDLCQHAWHILKIALKGKDGG